MKDLGEIEHTDRGFELIRFDDANGEACSLQQSSSATEERVWLGHVSERAHLGRGQVEALVSHLLRWMETGSFGPKTVAGHCEPFEFEDSVGEVCSVKREQAEDLIARLQEYVRTTNTKG